MCRSLAGERERRGQLSTHSLVPEGLGPTIAFEHLSPLQTIWVDFFFFQFAKTQVIVSTISYLNKRG